MSKGNIKNLNKNQLLKIIQNINDVEKFTDKELQEQIDKLKEEQTRRKQLRRVERVKKELKHLGSHFQDLQLLHKEIDQIEEIHKTYMIINGEMISYKQYSDIFDPEDIEDKLMKALFKFRSYMSEKNLIRQIIWFITISNLNNVFLDQNGMPLCHFF